LDEKKGQARRINSLWEIIVNWYVNSAERILRNDLLRDYSEHEDFLAAKRGQVIHLPTARAFYSGKLGFESRFEEFTTDTPLNRMLKAAADTVMKSTVLQMWA
jgi:5-methylcytosine-specific restriction endonuclease McrBC regulatory subunit McrC